MAQVVYRGNLSAKVFPFVSEYFGRTVIIPGPDQNFQRQVVSSEDADKDRGIPQILYCHNVMPSAEGFQSIGYKNILNDAKSGFKDIFISKDSNGNEVFFAHTTTGGNYVLPFGAQQWIPVSGLEWAGDIQISSGSFNGQTYFYFAKIGCYLYDAVNGALTPVELSGIDTSAVVGITACAGYMVAWTETSVAWSSTVDHLVPTDPIDFVPSLTTGAGGGNVEAAKGKITLCVPHYLGFIIYTTDNAVGAVYSGNARYPFNLREIVGSGGLANKALISFDAASGNHYAFTSSGLQLVAMTQSQTVFPDVTDFISGNYFEDFDESTLKLSHLTLESSMLKSIVLVADRYLVISYGLQSLTHALVYDLVQKRFGKLKINHVTAFEWKIAGSSVDIPRQSLAFLQADGSIKAVDFGYGSTASKGVMILGKYQLSRTRTITLDEVELENIKSQSEFSLYNLVSYDGKTMQPPVAGYLAADYGVSRKYNFHATGVNHTLLLKGNFYCSSIVLKFHANGRR